jgi:hypothetical protein
MRKLLIADDEDGIRSLVRMTLDTGAYEIIEARMENRHSPSLGSTDRTCCSWTS